MRFSLNFIQQLLGFKIAPQQLAKKLTMSGMEVEAISKAGGDWVFDIEVTTNRYDWLSMVGIAKEIAAVLGRKFKFKLPSKPKLALLKERDIIIENSQDCPYYIGQSIKGVKVKPAKQQIRELITSCGLTTVNNVVDITNYCMLKWGNPLHAFDEDKLKGNIYIRRARRGESFVGIDGKLRELDKDNLVIADEEKVVALAGVIGSKDTEVDQKTKNIFLEAAIFSPVTVRCSRRKAAIDTESSYRFERRVSADYLEYASCEAAQLIGKESGGVYSGIARAGRKPAAVAKKITLSLPALENYLGCAVAVSKFKNILSLLGFSLKALAKGKFQLLVPAQRFDLNSEVDVYEEVSRIYGYDKIPDKIPFLRKEVSLQKGVVENAYHFNNQLADYVSRLGFKEIITYSIEDKQALSLGDSEPTIEIVNPLRKQESSLRNNLLLGMVRSIRHNLNRNQNNLYFFEIAHSYSKTKGGFSEVPVLALGTSGKAQGFFYLKGAVTKILQYNNNQKFSFKKSTSPYFSDSLDIIIEGERCGFIGKLSESIKKGCDLKGDLFFAQINLAQLKEKSGQKRYCHFSPYPAVSRDISISLGNDLDFQEVEKIIKAESNYLVGLQVIDIYKGKDIPQDTTAFTLRIFYQSPNKTLTAQEVDTFHGKIRQALSQQRSLQLR